ncbi:hypothetical protein HPP92_013997 [Vanilla planifolia]|uniref:Uncharacterized protein n=1 Tax=Vanilla planifolia TaxID=51239 RepID=A0A835QPG0_VANPL|nr:hypothetical protein HPP92_013997 [Vanilla planifolia]
MNNLNGSIPPEIGKLSNLQFLSLASNQLTEEIPAKGLLSLSQPKQIDLSGNQLNGSIPPEMGKLSNLQFLSLASNQLTGEIPAKGLLSLSQLKELPR